MHAFERRDARAFAERKQIANGSTRKILAYLSPLLSNTGQMKLRELPRTPDFRARSVIVLSPSVKSQNEHS